MNYEIGTISSLELVSHIETEQHVTSLMADLFCRMSVKMSMEISCSCVHIPHAILSSAAVCPARPKNKHMQINSFKRPSPLRKPTHGKVTR